ncbi:MAG: hypothetical protein WA323_18105 [Candidatus Nitrosopolaris sp.]
MVFNPPIQCVVAPRRERSDKADQLEERLLSIVSEEEENFVKFNAIM